MDAYDIPPMDPTGFEPGIIGNSVIPVFTGII